MVTVTVTWHGAAPRPGRPPTIYEALRAEIGREPTNAELKAEVLRILRTPQQNA